MVASTCRALTRMILPYLAVIVLVLATVYAALVVFRQKPEGEAHAWLFPDGTRRSARILAGDRHAHICDWLYGLDPHECPGIRRVDPWILDSGRL